MGFFSDLGSTFVRGAADVATFGTNELAGNPAGKLYNQVVNPSDPNQSAKDLAQQNIAEQKDFAQNSIQWRVADAMKAGINPLAALGASGASFSPVSGPAPDTGPRDTLLSMLANMGQDLFRSHINAKSEVDRAAELENLRKLHAEADMAEQAALHSKLALVHDFAVPPNPAIPTVERAEGFPYGIPTSDFARVQFGDPSLKWDWMIRNRILAPLRDVVGNMVIRGGYRPWLPVSWQR